MKIAIVVPVMNLWRAYTKPCLDSARSKAHSIEFYVIDNASTDGTRRAMEELERTDPRMHLIHNSQNIGCGPAWNFGIGTAFTKGSDYVLVINNDILLHENAIDRLVERFERKERDVVMVTALDVRGEVPLPTMIDALDDRDKESTEESEAPNFSAFMINRTCWEEVGEFDNGFFPAYFEDNSYHYRMRLLGFRAIVYPPALFYHYGSRTQNESLEKPIVPGNFFEKNRAYFVEKWGGPPGDEKYDHPFNDKKKSLKWVLQHAHRENCDCEVSCVDLLEKFSKK